MAVLRPGTKKKSNPTMKGGQMAKKKFPNVEESVSNSYFGAYSVTEEMKEGGEYYAKPKEHIVTEEKDFIILKTFRYENGETVYFEDVYLNLESDNPPSSPAGKFITLFKHAKEWKDIRNHVVGIEIKMTEGKKIDGKKPRVFKNIVNVFEVEEDDLGFNDEKQTNLTTRRKNLAIDNLIEDDDEDILDDEEEEIDSQNMSQFNDDIFDEEDEDEEEE